MAYVKDYIIEALEELEFRGACATKDEEDKITAFIEGQVETTDGVLTRSLECDLRTDPMLFRAFWYDCLDRFEDIVKGFGDYPAVVSP
jgi:hypothetical protein